MAQKKDTKKNVKVKDLAPKKDAKGGASGIQGGNRNLDGGNRGLNAGGGRGLNAGGGRGLN
jgi:hypothetical protein